MSTFSAEASDAMLDALTGITAALNNFRHCALVPGAVVQGRMFDALSGMPVDRAADECLISALSDIQISAGSENGSVVRYPGIFEVDDSVLNAVFLLNERKDAFSGLVKEMEASGAKPFQLRTLYNKLGFSGIHPLQAWRKVNVLSAPGLQSVGFTVAKAVDSVDPYSRDEAISALNARGAFDIVEQIAGLSTEHIIYWHTPISRHIRANVVWRNEDTRSTLMFYTSLPFLVKQGCWPQKRVNFNQPRIHAKRKDTKGSIIIPLPFRTGAYLAA